MGRLRAVLAWLLVPLVCLLALLGYAVRPFNPDNNRILGRILARLGRRVLGMERPLEGAGNMPTDRPTVVIANHQHNDDLFIMADLLPPRTVTVGKAALAWVPFFGQVFWLGGNVMIDRSRSHKAVAVMQATTEAITRDSKSVWIFPEGTRSKGRGLQPFKKGAFYAAIAAGAPITMVVASPYNHACHSRTGRRAPVRVRILAPVETAGLTNGDIPDLMERCHRQMREALADLAS
ncbi:MAG: 1-acylglycerol-3-phosphate O-acyltransferase [Marinobacter sp.]|uniref:lysophospholipid acyltransferase family protein n=1 Tax=Marinobacter sp. TaxID=50741 RepID=UPI00299D137B|nr:1-acylglycerol-3-phosphate O-acyltransferase [Marinobacter sp.]MDX1634809.1 1-acylglycerol-3-phosphate O-acyltransferase [Marinobacter sp.]